MRTQAVVLFLCFVFRKPWQFDSAWHGAWLIPLVIAVSCVLSGCPSRTSPAKNPLAEEQPVQVVDLEPVPFSQKDSRTSFTSHEDNLDAVYLDLGDDVGFIFRSASNVMIVVDANGDHLPTPGIDRVYTVDLDEKSICVFELNSDAGACHSSRALATSARASVKLNANGGSRTEITLRVPRVELLGENGRGLIVLETFEPASASRGRRFPGGASAGFSADPFTHSFRLTRATGPQEVVPPSWPGLPKTPPPVDLQAVQPRESLHFRLDVNRKCFFFGEKPQLTWDIPPDGGAADLEPGFGNIHPPQEVSPEETQVYTLRHKLGNGDWAQESLTVQVCDVEIDDFRIQPPKARYGDPFTILWDVRGAKGIKLNPPGSLQASTMNSLGGVNIRSQTKLSLPATKADFPSPGSYKFTLTAYGPGGEKTRTAWLQIVE